MNKELRKYLVLDVANIVDDYLIQYNQCWLCGLCSKEKKVYLIKSYRTGWHKAFCIYHYSTYIDYFIEL